MTNFLLSASSWMPANGDTAFIIGVGGSVVVIVIMIILAGVFILIGKAMSKDLRLKKTVSQPAVQEKSGEAPIQLKGKLPANTVAAIATAIYQYMDEAHEEENTIITIDRAAKTYSPWSSKIYATHKGIFNSGRR